MNDVQSISSLAFKDCIGIENVIISGSDYKAVTEESFSGCTNLKTIYIPNTAVYVATNAFEGCTSLREIRFQAGATIPANSPWGAPSNPNIFVEE